jgi:hypothetical protein
LAFLCCCARFAQAGTRGVTTNAVGTIA